MKITYGNGDKYEGSWVDGELCGKGTMVYATGDTYEGLWFRGRRDSRVGAINRERRQSPHNLAPYPIRVDEEDLMEDDDEPVLKKRESWAEMKARGGKTTYRLPCDERLIDYPTEGTWTFATGQIMKGEFEDGEPVGPGTVSNPIGPTRVYFDSSNVARDVAVEVVGGVEVVDLAKQRWDEECKRRDEEWKKKEEERKQALEEKRQREKGKEEEKKAEAAPKPPPKPPQPPPELEYTLTNAYIRWSGDSLKANELKKSGLQYEKFELSLEFRTPDESAPLM